MDNIKNCNNYKTLRTYNPNILNSDINCNSIENFGGAFFLLSSAVRYPWKNRPCDQVGIEGFSTTCDDALTQVAIAQAALNGAYQARRALEAEEGGGGGGCGEDEGGGGGGGGEESMGGCKKLV